MGGHGNSKGGSRSKGKGKGASRKGGKDHRDGQRQDRRGSKRGNEQNARHDRHDRDDREDGDDNGEFEEIDVEEVCNNLEDLASNSKERRYALAKLYTGHFKSPEVLARSCPAGSENRARLTSALETGLTYFGEKHRNRVIQVLEDHDWKLNLKEDARNRGRGSGPHGRQDARRDRGGRDDREEVSSRQIVLHKKPGRGGMMRKNIKQQLQRQRQKGNADDAEDHRRHDKHGRQGGKGGPPQREDKKRKTSGKEDHMRPGRGSKRGRTGANTIDVDWKPPPKESDEDERVDGVTPKSAPRPPKSPVRGPAGRGQSATKPAWMTSSPGGAAVPAICDGRAASPPPSSAGRGRGSAEPSWKKGTSDRGPPSMPAIEDGDKDSSAATAEPVDRANDPLESFYNEGREEGHRQEDDDWHQNQKWGGRGRSRSRTRGDAGSKRQTQRRAAASSGGRSKWNSKDQGERQQPPWDRSAREPARHESRAESHGEWEQEKSQPEPGPELVLRCCKHGKKRNFTRLVKGEDGNWTCRPDSPCVVVFNWEGPKRDGLDKDNDLSPAGEEEKKEPQLAIGYERSSTDEQHDKRSPDPHATGAESAPERPQKARLRPRPGKEEQDDPLPVPVEEADPRGERRHRKGERREGERRERSQKKQKKSKHLDAPPGWPSMYPGTHPGMAAHSLPPPPPLPPHRAHGPPMHPRDMTQSYGPPPMPMMAPHGYHPGPPMWAHPMQQMHMGRPPPFNLPPPGAMPLGRPEGMPHDRRSSRGPPHGQRDDRRQSHNDRGSDRRPGHGRHAPGSQSRGGGSRSYQAHSRGREMRIDDTDL